jgi:hypothetical protein
MLNHKAFKVGLLATTSHNKPSDLAFLLRLPLSEAPPKKD